MTCNDFILHNNIYKNIGDDGVKNKDNKFTPTYDKYTINTKNNRDNLKYNWRCIGDELPTLFKIN